MTTMSDALEVPTAVWPVRGVGGHVLWVAVELHTAVAVPVGVRELTSPVWVELHPLGVAASVWMGVCVCE